MAIQGQYDSGIVYFIGQQVVVDGVLYEATAAVPVDTSPPNADYWEVVSGEIVTPSPAGIPAHYVQPFAWNSLTSAEWAAEGLPVTGYQPNDGDLILAAWFETDTLWNGTTPKADIGTFDGGNDGVFTELLSGTISLGTADSAITDNAGLDKIATDVLNLDTAGMPIRVTSPANPLTIIVSETGVKGGTAAGASAGSSTLHLIVVPAL